MRFKQSLLSSIIIVTVIPEVDRSEIFCVFDCSLLETYFAWEVNANPSKAGQYHLSCF